MPAQILRPYQADGLKRILASYAAGSRSVMGIGPTAMGKTTLFGTLASQVVNAGRRVVVLVHRRELASQAANRFREFGTDFGYIMAGEQAKPSARLQIASVQTLVRRAMPPADLVICDEAHLSTAQTWQQILASYPRARILGVTATPWRLGGKPLVGTYDDCVVIATPDQLRQQGYLCDYAGFSYLAPDLSKVKTTGGDYNEAQSAAAMRAPQLVDSVVEEWLAHASTLSTIVFAVTVEHSKELCAKFKGAGVRAEHLDGTTPIEQRKAILKRLDNGDTRVLCNVGVAVEGLDVPRVKCIVLARPTQSLARYIQMAGRGRRPWNGQVCRIHDHAFNMGLHGLPDDERDYSLDAKPIQPPNLSTCSECLAMYRGRTCPQCAHENEVKAAGPREIISVTDAEKVEFTSGGNGGGGEGAEEAARPPVEVKWDKTGRCVEGVFRGSAEITTEYGKEWRHRVAGKRDYILPGTVVLNTFFRERKAGDRVRVTQRESTNLSGGKSRKEFKLELDEPDPEWYAQQDVPDWVKAFGASPAVSAVLRRRWSACNVGKVLGDDGEQERVVHATDSVMAEHRRLCGEAGMSANAAAKKLGFHGASGCVWAKKGGYNKEPPGAPDSVLAEHRRLVVEDGMAAGAAGKKLGFNEGSGNNWAKKGGYNKEPPGAPDSVLAEHRRLVVEDGMSADAAGKKLGFSGAAGCVWAKKGGYNKSRSDGNRLRAGVTDLQAGTKICSICKETKPLDCFYKRTETRWSGRCKPCGAIYHSQWRAARQATAEQASL